MVARKPAIKRGPVTRGALRCHVRRVALSQARCAVTSGALRCHVRPSGRLPDRLHDPRLAQDVKLPADRPHLERLALKDDLRVLLRACIATDFAVADALEDERNLLGLEQNLGGGV